MGRPLGCSWTLMAWTCGVPSPASKWGDRGAIPWKCWLRMSYIVSSWSGKRCAHQNYTETLFCMRNLLNKIFMMMHDWKVNVQEQFWKCADQNCIQIFATCRWRSVSAIFRIHLLSQFTRGSHHNGEIIPLRLARHLAPKVHNYSVLVSPRSRLSQQLATYWPSPYFKVFGL